MKKTKLYLIGETFYVDVVLFDKVFQLKIATKDRTAAGLYRPEPYTIYPKTRVKKKLGTIFLAKERLGVGYISHEVLHCIFDFREKRQLRGKIIKKESVLEEKLCYHLGDVTRQICNWLNDKKLW